MSTGSSKLGFVRRDSLRSWRLFVATVALATGSIATAHAQPLCQPLPRGVVGFWPGDDTANDLTLAANHGQLMNGATFGPGVIGNAFNLDGVDDRVDVTDAPNLRLQRFTLNPMS